MVRRKVSSSKKSKRKEPEFGYQNISLWEKENSKSGVVMSGYVQLTPEFLEDLLIKVEEEEIEISDSGHIQLVVALYESTAEGRNASDYFGSIFVGEPREEKTTKKNSRRSSRDEDDEDDEDEEETPDPRRRKASRTARSNRPERESRRSSRR